MTQKATLYYRSEFPSFGYSTDPCHLINQMLAKNWHNAPGNVVVVDLTRKGKHKQNRAVFGGRHNLVIVKGWTAEFVDTVEERTGPLTVRSQRYGTEEELNAAYDAFLVELQESGAEVIADYRGVELGFPSSLGPPRSGVFEAPLDKNALAKQIDPCGAIYTEGALATVELDVYERDPRARQECIDHFKPICQICGFDFGIQYPGIGDRFIEVHHLKPLSQIQESHIVDPKKDLLPVCSNCHSMIHRRRPDPYTPAQIQEIMQQGRDNEPPF